MDTIFALSGAQQARLIRDKAISPVELARETFARIHRLNPVLNAFCALDEERAMAAAQVAEAAVMRDDALGPLHGVPFSVKDLILTQGLRTTFGSRVYEDYVPDEDDVSVARLKQAGAILLGKTIPTEFGYACSNPPIHGDVRNPWDTSRTPSGSSGGSAVAVATGMGALTVGSDGGGSIRVPASFTGLFGYKPSFGRVPLYPGCRDPQMPGASSWETLECIGPLTRTVEDGALMMEVMSGPSAYDRHSLPGNPAYVRLSREADLRGLTVAWSTDMGFAVVDPEVRRIVADGAKLFERLGCDVKEAHPGLGFRNDTFAALIARDTDLAGMRRLAERHGAAMDPLLLEFVNRDWTAQDLTDAAMARQEINVVMRRFMSRYDLFVVPTIGIKPYALDAGGVLTVDGQRLERPRWSTFTNLANMTGLPAASVPCGWTSEGLPVGLQIVGRPLDDELVFRACFALERENPWEPRLRQLIERYG